MSLILPKVPDFFIAGAPKCGTTTLYNWLAAHPEIHAPHKEICFFSQDIFPTKGLLTHIPDLNSYIELVSKGAPKNAIIGEGTPKYLYSDLALSEIHSIHPAAKFILSLRDPVDLAISLHNQKLREGVENESNFEKAWERSLNSLACGDTSPQMHETNYYLWACIGSRLRVLYSYFPSSAVLIILTRELRSDPLGCYLKTLDFLGLDDDGRREFSSSNERVGIRSLDFNRTLLKIRKFMEPGLRVLWRLRGGQGVGLLKLASKINEQPGRYTTSVSKKFRGIMYKQLSDEITLAESYLNGRWLVQ